MKKTTINGPIYDARALGTPRMLVLGLQHMFAMFGATVLVPALTGLNVATALLFAGIGTLLFHLLTKGKVPAFLGSSFAFIGGYNAIRTVGTAADGSAIYNNALLPYACFGVLIAGLMYVILAALFKLFGVKKVMRFFPPIVTGPIIIAIGLTLSSSAINNCKGNWLVAVVAIAIVIGFNMWGKGMTKIIPILLGVLGSYIFALIVDPAEREAVSTAVANAAWIGVPVNWNSTVFGLFSGEVDTALLWSAVFTIVPLSLATMVEHIGDICAISSTVGRNYMTDPGFHRTLLGDGLATSLAALFGGPANTTYGENTGVLALSKVYDPRVIRIAACIAILVSFCPKFAALVSAMPTATIGGVSLILYGMISAVGVRNVVENRVDFTNTRNVIIAALILVLSIGISYSGSIQIGIVSLSGLAVASIVGIALNAVLPGKDYEFEQEHEGSTSVDLSGAINMEENQ
ncbi:MAG: uracil-xanthine permease family protein [Eubacteriales bacterium]|nr:uracil-xanthine permease family protein [Eubacteriales bacterium]